MTLAFPMTANARTLRYEPNTSAWRPSLDSRLDFLGVTRDGVRQVRPYLDTLPKKEARLLDDVSRGKGLAMVRQALEIARHRASCPAAATGLLENWRGFVLAGHTPGCAILDAFGWETEAQGGFDVAQFAYAENPSEANRLRAIEAGNRQLAETRRALDALHGVQR